MIPTTELLAPARDLACGIAAVDAGADAVYIGAPRFGARARAGNDLGDIAALVAYAHTYWARVYVTVNTLLHDDEVAGAVELITDLYGIGVDAVIVQDVGLLECDLPPIALIASTQMHNHTPERVAFLERIGFQRAILARELTLDEIRAIREATVSIELESFVHGALCVSYSGQCYMSYAVGGRSGNRGECAQPCRRRYDLVDSRGRVLVRDRFLLSLRDMNRSADLGAMLDAGVTSLKIEGRLKDTAYVTNVVSAYRQALDAAMAPRGLRRSSSGQSRIDFAPSLHKTFNRAYTPYFLHGRDRSPGSTDTPKMIGEPVGTITALSAKTFTIETAIELHNGDGLSFFDTTDTLCGTVVNGTQRTQQGLAVTPNAMNGLRVGTKIHRNRDHAYLSRIETQPPERTIGIRISLSETTDGFEIQVEDEDANRATVRTIQEKSPARKPQQAEETARKQLSKTGGTPFHCQDITINWARPYFLPFSTLNELRRDALEKLLETRAAGRPIMTNTLQRNDAPHPATRLDFRGNALNAKAVAFYRRHGVTEIEPAAESGLDMRGRVVMTTRYCIKEELGWCPRQIAAGADKAPGPNETLYLVDEHGHRYELRFRCHQAPDGCGMDIDY
ncbi:MAG: U32 family peptidase [Anaerolineae bacterium]|nr:U32 family peptidase [Anaerolineae bacterium]